LPSAVRRAQDLRALPSETCERHSSIRIRPHDDLLSNLTDFGFEAEAKTWFEKNFQKKLEHVK